MYQGTIVLQDPSTWKNLRALDYHDQKRWIRNNLPEVLKILVSLPMKSFEFWNVIGYLCIDNNLYHEAEKIYDELFKKMQRDHGDTGTPAYLRGIAHFLEGRFGEAYRDFKTSRQYDLQNKKVNCPSARALAYM